MARILIIDDDFQIRCLFRQVLEGKGHQVLDASDGRSGIDMQRREPADLVITDIVMPDKEGLETIRDLRRDWPEVKIIAISGGGKIVPGEYLHVADKFGAHRGFEKPIHLDEMMDAVNELLAEA